MDENGSQFECGHIFKTEDYTGYYTISIPATRATCSSQVYVTFDPEKLSGVLPTTEMQMPGQYEKFRFTGI